MIIGGTICAVTESGLQAIRTWTAISQTGHSQTDHIIMSILTVPPAKLPGAGLVLKFDIPWRGDAPGVNALELRHGHMYENHVNNI